MIDRAHNLPDDFLTLFGGGRGRRQTGGRFARIRRAARRLVSRIRRRTGGRGGAARGRETGGTRRTGAREGRRTGGRG
jgi:hypothetical protein